MCSELRAKTAEMYKHSLAQYMGQWRQQDIRVQERDDTKHWPHDDPLHESIDSLSILPHVLLFTAFRAYRRK